MIRMIEEIRAGAVVEAEEQEVSTLDACLEAVGSLDGSARSLISFSRDGLTLLVGGGGGGYVITVETSREIRNLLNGGESGQDESELTVGGQACEYP
ncbi:hypothetical protein [Paenibacillus donghaensis]|uniref:Uncharacterized protein n=1 Tax=Paenibacillus donghaensis TaxID=414771 RepID=A0A2Z2KQD8_9BACL|nr:hypothetical protein [Paenibacillus donghaensis]ASA22531.1 hypothetical protein B9T62_18135 [Paenibacillus donghaensis]